MAVMWPADRADSASVHGDMLVPTGFWLWLVVLAQISLTLTLPVAVPCVPLGRTVLWLSLPYVSPNLVVESPHSPSSGLKRVQMASQLSLPHTSKSSDECFPDTEKELMPPSVWGL